ncbi:MAG: hypothetical protein ACI39U_05415 [Candidatus Cryptobacteroides sp.]
MNNRFIDIFIPSYHRPHNLKTMKYFLGLGYDPGRIHVLVDSEADDIAEYEEEVVYLSHCNLHVFDMEEARRRYDYVHRVSVTRRSAGQARNMFMDDAREKGINFYVVQDDDTSNMQVRPFRKYFCVADLDIILDTFNAVKDMMERHHIGLFGLPQTGDIYNKDWYTKSYIRKVMNTTFYLMPYVYRGERSIQDNDTSLFTGVLNEGLFTGSCAGGLTLLQTPSATAKGGLTDLYNECKLLNKSLAVPIQFPSAVQAERQIKNGGRLHHKINYRYLAPKIIRGSANNIAWDTYPEDVPFTNEPCRTFSLNR